MQESSQTSHFDRIGGSESVRRLSDRFYDIMESDPAAADILSVHPEDLTAIREKFYEFLCGWLGGPPLYMNKYGHPRLRMRHMHIAIDSKSRDQWMYCMNKAMDELVEDNELRQTLSEAFYQVADFMRNQGPL